MQNAIHHGKVVFWNDERGYGFLAEPGGPDVFVHISGVADEDAQWLRKDDNVSFEVGAGRRGMQAVNVTRLKN